MELTESSITNQDDLIDAWKNNPELFLDDLNHEQLIFYIKQSLFELGVSWVVEDLAREVIRERDGG